MVIHEIEQYLLEHKGEFYTFKHLAAELGYNVSNISHGCKRLNRWLKNIEFQRTGHRNEMMVRIL